MRILAHAFYFENLFVGGVSHNVHSISKTRPRESAKRVYTRRERKVLPFLYGVVCMCERLCRSRPDKLERATLMRKAPASLRTSQVNCKETRDLVERPGNLLSASGEVAIELLEDLFANVNAADGAAGALVADSGLDRLAVAVDGDCLVALGVAVGLGTHEFAGEGDNVLGFVLTAVVEATSAHADVVVGNVARVLTGAGAAAGAALGGCLGLGRGRGLGSRGRRGDGWGRRRRSSGSGGGGRRRGRGCRRAGSGRGGRRRRRRRGRRGSGGRGLLGLLDRRRSRLKKLGVGWRRNDLVTGVGRDRLAGGDEESGADVDNLGDGLGLGHPFNLGDGDKIAAVERLGQDGGEEGGGGESKGLHDEWCWVSVSAFKAS